MNEAAPFAREKSWHRILRHSTNHNTILRRSALCVDMIKKFPFLATGLSPYYDREIRGVT